MDPHPLTGEIFASPVPPGSGWPGDPATAATPVAATAAQVRKLAAAADGIPAIDAAVSRCRACPRLARWREEVATTGRRASFAGEPYWGRPVPSFGDPAAPVLIVGLAPAANGANRTGRMFTGDASGDFLYAALHRTGYANQPESVAAGDGMVLTGIRITAAVHCAPPQNKPTPQEKANCLPWLRRDLELSPQVHTIITLGAIGWAAVLDAAAAMGWDVPHPKPKFAHGADVIVSRADGRPRRVVGCFHVSPHNTYTHRLTPEMLDAVLLSLRQDA